LAKALSKHHDVEFAVWTPHNGYPGAAGRSLIDEAANRFKVYEWKTGVLERQAPRLSRLLEFFGVQLPLLLVGGIYPARLALVIKDGLYDVIIPVEQHALYCAWRAMQKFAPALSKIVYYSLEVQTPSDADVNSRLRCMILEERRIVRHVGGIIIQDVNRLSVLGDDLPQTIPKVYLIPLFSDRAPFTGQSNVLHEAFGIDQSKKILLYFGFFYAERMLDAIVGKFRDANRGDLVLVLHNPAMTLEETRRFQRLNQNIILSTRFLSDDELDALVASADMGLALYDNHKPNTRFTAFSSEKICTYLRCGVPFIAFDNESYRELAAHHDCCALIQSIEELGGAMDKLSTSREHYAREAQSAYRSIFYRTELNLQ
jgi:glycosyltransferase involved in cell wall biosynthesis